MQMVADPIALYITVDDVHITLTIYIQVVNTCSTCDGCRSLNANRAAFDRYCREMERAIQNGSRELYKREKDLKHKQKIALHEYTNNYRILQRVQTRIDDQKYDLQQWERRLVAREAELNAMNSDLISDINDIGVEKARMEEFEKTLLQFNTRLHILGMQNQGSTASSLTLSPLSITRTPTSQSESPSTYSSYSRTTI